MDISAHPKGLCFNRGSAAPFSFCSSISKCTKFELLTDLLTKVQRAWDVTLLWLANITYISKSPTAFVFEVKQSKENHFLHGLTLKMKTLWSFETSWNIFPTVQCRIPPDFHPLHQRFSNFFQVGTTFISQNVLRTTLLLGLSNSLGLP